MDEWWYNINMQQSILRVSACKDRVGRRTLEGIKHVHSYIKIKYAIARNWFRIAGPEFLEWFTEYFEKKTFATRSRYPTIYKAVHMIFAISIVIVCIQAMTWFYKIVPPLVSSTYQSAIIDRATPEPPMSCQIKE